MIRKTSLLSLIAGLVIGCSAHLFSQVPTGTPPFGTFQNDGFDTIDLANLNTQFAIPIFARLGRAGFNFSYVMTYDSSVWYPAGAVGYQTWSNDQNWGWKGQTQVATGYVLEKTYSSQCLVSGHYIPYNRFNFYGYVDAYGVMHKILPPNYPVALFNSPCGVSNDQQTVAAADGYTISVTLSGTSTLSAKVYPRHGGATYPPVTTGIGAAHSFDHNGNEISTDGTNFTDTQGTVALTVSGTAPNPVLFEYTNYLGSGNYAKVMFNYTSRNVATKFGCSGISDVSLSSVPLVTSISLPDGTSYGISYEGTPGSTTGQVTGRIAEITLPTGGYVRYQYSGGNQGIECSDGSTAGMTVTVYDGTNTNIWTYSRSGSGSAWTTTMTDPLNNRTIYQFEDLYETERQVNQYNSGNYSTIETVYTCYNGTNVSTFTSCPTTAVSTPISRRTRFTALPNTAGRVSEVDEHYDSLGYITERDLYDYGSGTPSSTPLEKHAITYNSFTQAINNDTYSNTFEVPASDVVRDSAGNLASETTYSYDAAGSLTSSGLTQLATVTGSRGNLTSEQMYITSSTYLQKKFTYYDTGALITTTDVNSAQTTNSYSGITCNGAFPTAVTLPNGLSRSMSWNCTGSVLTSLTDENNQPINWTYNDVNYWRPTAFGDQENNVSNISYLYGGSPLAQQGTEISLTFNSNNSVADQRVQWDTLWRPHVIQRRQSPSSSEYDSAEVDRNGIGLQSKVTVPYQGTAGTLSGGTGMSTTYDALGRTLQTTDGGGGTLSFTYTYNDVLRALGPAPNSSETTKQIQWEYNVAGWLMSVCEITSAAGTTCNQASSKAGYWTQYQYNGSGNLTNVTQNGQQIRTYTYDLLGRLTYEKNPESGATNYYYDTDATCGTSEGDLVKRVDAIGNVTCFAYDKLHRLIQKTYPAGSYSTVTAEKHYVYDSATINGAAMSNAAGRLAEAYTGSSSNKITDLGFSYSPRGELTDTYEWTSHSGGYYHLFSAYWPDGSLETMSVPGVPQLSYHPDGEGRIASVTVPSGQGQNPVADVVYGDAWRPDAPTKVTFGSGDYDSFGYDSSTARMTSYGYTIGSTPQTYTGALNWNANGTLATLTISDPFLSGDSQTCTYIYDDLARLGSVNCVNGSTNIWNQDFTYGAYGNIAKTVPSGGTGTAFDASYNTSNQITTVGSVSASYDLNGNLTFDPTTSIHYTWDADNRPATLNGFGMTVDALGRIVEKDSSGTYLEYVFAPNGKKVAVYAGQTLKRTYLPLPGGSEVNYGSSGMSAYAHTDWLGSIRLAVTPGRSVIADIPYGPYGEAYSTRTGTYSPEFTGQALDITSPLNDFMYREYNYIQGRWISPDPGGMAAADAANPQTWNRYAYAIGNPLVLTDPLGLQSGWPGPSPWGPCGPADDPVPGCNPEQPGGGTPGSFGGTGCDPMNGEYCNNLPPRCPPQGSQRMASCTYVSSAPKLKVRTPEEVRKEHACVDKALVAAAVAFGGTFIPNLPPQAEATDSAGYALDTAKAGAELLKNPGVRAVILTDAANISRGLLPAAADALDMIPGLDVIIVTAQVGYGAYQAVQAYKESFDQCMGATD